MSALLSVSGLVTHLGGAGQPVRAVDGIDFEIKPGETFALLGESGCGKSMTALSLMRLLPPSGRIVSGAVTMHTTDVLRLPETAMRKVRGGGMSMIFQEPMTSLNPVLTIGQQIGEALRVHKGARRADARGQIIELLKAVGIPAPEQRIDEYPHQLSGGMKQRAVIAIALAGEPELLIADEPTTALDVTIQAQVLQLLRDLQKERGMSVLLITHDLGVVAQMADRVAVMYAGQIVEQADRDDFFNSPRHPYSRKLFDSLPGIHKRDQLLHVIEGFVPSLSTQFTGCRFASRCDRVMDICHQQLPAWAEIDGHRVLCHLYKDNHDDRQIEKSAREQTSARPVPTATKPLLSVRNLRIHFPIHAGLFRRTVGYVKAVDDIDLDIPQGQTLALVGESGCGKTTVGKGILQLLRPTTGQVLFDGVDLCGLSRTELRPRRSDFQIIFQDPYSSMNPRMIVGDIIAEGMKALEGANRAVRDTRVKALLEQVGLAPDSIERYPHEFSGGQRQRISIARAIAMAPKLIVCDEPTSALDVSVQAQILNLLQRLQSDMKISYLFITHNISVVAYLAHEVAVMYLGRIVERGSVDDILNRPQHPYTQALLSAVPVVDINTKREVIKLSGDIPSPSNPPSGCHFHPRCPHAMEQCRTSYPSAHSVNAHHQVSCHLYSD